MNNQTGHHRRSTRLPDHDYRRPGAYFVTLVAYEREPLFGTVENGVVRLNTWGAVIASAWMRLETLFSVQLDAWVLMPNHLHGIVWFREVPGRGEAAGAKDSFSPNTFVPAASPLHPEGRRIIGTQSGSLAAIVQNFKSVTTIRINRLRQTPGCPVWQRNYYDHIIRNEIDLARVRAYITENPSRWNEDDENQMRCANR